MFFSKVLVIIINYSDKTKWEGSRFFIFKRSLTLILVITTIFLSSCNSGHQQSQVVYIKQISNPETLLNTFKHNEIDAFLLWEPYPQEAEIEAYGKILQKSSEIWPNHPDCIVAISGNMSDKSLIEAFMWAHIKSTRFITDPANKEKVLRYAMEFINKNRAVTEAALANTRFDEFPDPAEFKNFYHELTKTPVLTKKVTDMGYKSNEDFFNSFIDLETYNYISAKLNQDPDWQPSKVPGTKTLKFGRIIPGLFHLGSYIAEKEGIYEKVGLIPGQNLEIQNFLHGIAIMQKFKTNELDIAYVGVSPATLKRINDNIDVRIIGGIEGEDSGLVVRNDENINSVSDLAGKTVAVPAIGNVQYLLLEKALRAAGLKTVVK